MSQIDYFKSEYQKIMSLKNIDDFNRDILLSKLMTQMEGEYGIYVSSWLYHKNDRLPKEVMELYELVSSSRKTV